MVVPLHRVIPKKKWKGEICAFDMETRGLGGEFIVCAFSCSDGLRYIANTIEECFQFILDHSQYRFLAHNARGYEFVYLYPIMVDYFQSHEEIEILPPIQGEDRIIQFQIRRNGKKWIDIRDTLCLFNSSLAQVAKGFCPELPKGEPPWNKKHDNFNPDSKEWMDYLWRDCEIILVAYQRHATNIWNSFHVNLGVTAGSTAMKAYIATIPEGHVYYRINKEQEKFVRDGYYGAAVFPGHEVGDWGETASIDINGAYGHQMGRHLFPVGSPARTFYCDPELLGVYKVVAAVPNSVYLELGFNPWPCRTKNGLVWKSGTFETTLTNIELEYGIKHGCSFEVIEGLVWYRAEPVFKEFIEKCQLLELEHPEQKPSVKLMRNSCYGKFGTKEEHNIIVFSHETPDTDRHLIPMTNATNGKLIENVYVGTEPTNSPFILPHWASFITAYQRIYLFGFMEQVYRAGARSVYCDTDSIKSSSSIILRLIDNGIIPIGKEYGKFKLEYVTKEFLLIGPKTFYANEVEKKAKGLPNRLLTRDTYVDALNNNRKEVAFESVESVKNLIKGKKQLQIKRKRTITDISNSIAWEVIDKEIYPRGYLQL